jgi:hypothetical protein
LLIDAMSRLCPRLVCALALVTGACVTPSIPVPPPDPQAMSFTIDGATGPGTATFAYTSNPTLGGATVYVFDRAQGKGVIDTFRRDGTVGPTAPFPATAGDEIDVTFQEGDQAQSICVLLKVGTPSTRCP